MYLFYSLNWVAQWLYTKKWGAGHNSVPFRWYSDDMFKHFGVLLHFQIRLHANFNTFNTFSQYITTLNGCYRIGILPFCLCKLTFVSCMSFFFLGFIKYRVPVCRALCDSMRSVVSNTERRRQSCCTTVTTVLCSRHRVPHPEVLESLGSAPACGVGSERVWVDLASSWPVCQPQLQQCATVSTQTPLCLSSSSSSSSELNPSTAVADGMEAQSVVFFSPFSMFTVVFHLEREESKLSLTYY